MRGVTRVWHAGIEVTDRARLEQAGIQPGQVARIVSEAFNDMIFLFGDVHCDPHAANLFVRKLHNKAGPPDTACAGGASCCLLPVPVPAWGHMAPSRCFGGCCPVALLRGAATGVCQCCTY